MRRSIPEGHPYFFVRSVLSQLLDEVVAIHLGIYKYEPQVLRDEREVIAVPIRDFLDSDKMALLLDEVSEDREMAFHSDVTTVSGERKHMPMVDMSTGAAAHLEKIRPLLGSEIYESFTWFRSGRSFHGYGGLLIQEREWVQLMGALLLANQKGLMPTVDPRWVGHRLIAGYSALRWTRNTPYYLGIPQKT